MPDYNSPSKSRVESSIKALSAEVSNLSPSSVVTMFEIDVTEVLEANNVPNLSAEADAYGLPTNLQDNILRFHNNINIFNSYIKWQGNTYYPAPIQAEGFEVSTRGTLPTPSFTISTQSEEGINLMGLLRHQIRKFGDIIGAKVTRIRTYAKFLDVDNFLKVDSVGNVSTANNMASENLLEIPQGFEPDPYAELPRDIFFVERKESENKAVLKYQLASTLDLEGLTLPKRVIFADRCMFQYRGPGCWYQHVYDGSQPATGGFNETAIVVQEIWTGTGAGNWTNASSRFGIVKNGAETGISGSTWVSLSVDSTPAVLSKGQVIKFPSNVTFTIDRKILDPGSNTATSEVYATNSEVLFGYLTGNVANDAVGSIDFSFNTLTSTSNNASLAAVRTSPYTDVKNSIAESPAFTAKAGEKFKLSFKFTLNAGQVPTFQIINASGADKEGWSNTAKVPVDVTSGDTVTLYFTVRSKANNSSNNAKIQVFNSGNQTSNWSITDVNLAKVDDQIPLLKKAGLDTEIRNRIMPKEAPPVATDNNERIINSIKDAPSRAFVDRGPWKNDVSYNKGDYVYQVKNGIKYYFVAKEANGPSSTIAPPPNQTYWIADQCSKSVGACRMRWGIEAVKQGGGGAVKGDCVIGGPASAVNNTGGLPYGGFPAAKRVQQTVT